MSGKIEERSRLVFIALALSFLFCLLIVRFYQIQIIEGQKWSRIALLQQQTVLIEPAMRGSFYSNTSIKTGHPEDRLPFVVDVPKFHLYIDPDSIPAPLKERMASELFQELRFTKEECKKGSLEFERASRSRKISMWLDHKEKERVLAWWKLFAQKEKIPKNALFFLSDYRRSYPFGTLLGPVLHTVQDEKDPKEGEHRPTGGLEMAYHPYLKGKPGKRLITRTPRHPLDTGTLLVEPKNGADVYLTINHYLQAVVENELLKGVQIANAKGGWAVMMDPKNGEILALAQVPSFDPARYADYFNDPKLIERTHVKAVSECFEPGSIMKPLILGLCLAANDELKLQGKKPIFSPDEKVATANGHFPGRSTPLKDGRVHHFLNMNLALQKSSNIYMGRMMQRLIDTMGERWVRSNLEERYGFGKKTGIELPAESPGVIPTPGKLHPNGKLEWSTPTPYSLSMGHNILVNSIQMARAYAIFANGGYLVEPHIVKKIARRGLDQSEEILYETKKKPGKQVMSLANTLLLTRGLKFVTKEGASSKRADVPGYSEAGKSGTSEKIIAGNYSKQHHVSTFVGFVPANKDPRFVLLVSIDDPEKKFIPGVGRQQLGGVCAGPVFREIAIHALQYLGVEPDDPAGFPPGDPRRDPKRADWAFEVDALKKLYQEWNER
jgi:cell division protein FtsI (penicillin-binding protein 3)